MTEKEKYNPDFVPTGDYEIPVEPCKYCIKAEWYDLYGTWVFCCDMFHCIADEEEYNG